MEYVGRIKNLGRTLGRYFNSTASRLLHDERGSFQVLRQGRVLSLYDWGTNKLTSVTFDDDGNVQSVYDNTDGEFLRQYAGKRGLKGLEEDQKGIRPKEKK